MIEAWQRIDAWLAANASSVLKKLRPPVTGPALAALEQGLNRPVPVSLRDAYRAHDGARGEERAIFGAVRVPPDARWARCMWWLSAEKTLGRYRFMRDLSDQWPSTLLPIAEDAGGNLLVVDLDQGTLSAWDHETWGSRKLADDFGAWMEQLAADMAAGLVVAGSEEDDEDATLTLLDAPPPLPASPPALVPDRAARVLLDVLLERRFIALVDNADRSALVAALTRALATKGAKRRRAKVIDVLEESEVVDEIFVDDDPIGVLVDDFG